MKIIYHYSYSQAILTKNLPISQQICVYREILYDGEISMISAF